jgi:hypothetical protein
MMVDVEEEDCRAFRHYGLAVKKVSQLVAELYGLLAIA